MALLRAQGHEVLSTNRGYLIQAPLRVSRIFKVFHTSEQIVDELCTIVDLGGTVEDVFVHHKISADSGETLDLIGQELGKKGYLCQ